MRDDMQSIKNAVLQAIEEAGQNGTVVIINQLQINYASGGGAKVVLGNDRTEYTRDRVDLQDLADRPANGKRGPADSSWHERLGIGRDRGMAE